MTQTKQPRKGARPEGHAKSVESRECLECGKALRSDNRTGECGACLFDRKRAESDVWDFWEDYRPRVRAAIYRAQQQSVVEEFVLGAAQQMVSRIEGRGLLGSPAARIRRAIAGELTYVKLRDAWDRLREQGWVGEIKEGEWWVVPHIPEKMIELRRKYGYEDSW